MGRGVSLSAQPVGLRSDQHRRRPGSPDRASGPLRRTRPEAGSGPRRALPLAAASASACASGASRREAMGRAGISPRAQRAGKSRLRALAPRRLYQRGGDSPEVRFDSLWRSFSPSSSCGGRVRRDGAESRRRRTPSQVRLSFAPVVKKVTPAVVNVYASRVETAPRNPLFDDPIFRQFFGGGGDSRVSKSLGSGVIVDPRVLSSPTIT